MITKNIKTMFVLYVSIKFFHNKILKLIKHFYYKILIFMKLSYLRKLIFISLFYFKILILMKFSQVLNQFNIQISQGK